MMVFAFPLKRFLSLMMFALLSLTLTACGGGSSGGGGSSAAADDMTDMPDMTPEPPPPPPPPIEYEQPSSQHLTQERNSICSVWIAGRDLNLTPHADRDAGDSWTSVLLVKEQRDEFCGKANGPDGNPIGTSEGATDSNPFGSTTTLSYNNGTYGSLCFVLSFNGQTTAGMPDTSLYIIRIGTSPDVYVGVTKAQIVKICGGPILAAFDSKYGNGYLDIGEMRAVNLSSDVSRTQPQLDTLRQSSIALSHLFQRGAMQDNMIQTHDEFGNAVSFTPLQAQSIKSSYGLSDAMHDLTFTAKHDEVFRNEQARLAFTTNKYDSAQSNLNAQYRFGNMFISGDYSPIISGGYRALRYLSPQTPLMQFMQISDSANDVGTLRVSHKISDTMSFTQKAGAGTLSTGNHFDEISTALSYQKADKRLSIGAGRLREYDQFLGSVTTGAYALDEATESAYLSLHADMALGKNLTMQANYSAMNSGVSLHHDDFVRVTDLRSDSYDVKLQSKMKRGNLSLQYLVPLAVTDGTWQQRNVVNLQDTITRQDLSVNDRHQQWNLHYQSDGNIFATLTRDENYSNIAGLNETRIMTGVSKKF